MTGPRARGFSLIEVITAVAIIALTAVASSVVLQRVTVSSEETKNQDLALKIARNQLEVVRMNGYASTTASGTFADPLLADLPSGAGTLAVADFNAKTRSATVTVSWAARDMTRSVSLSTLMTETCGLP